MPGGFEFLRSDGGAAYRFMPVDGIERTWQRTDLSLWCREVAGRGWLIVDAHGLVLGWPEQAVQPPPARPPEGKWLSSKDGRGYEYELRWLT